VHEAVLLWRNFLEIKMLLTTFHFLSINRTLEEKYELNLPPYPGFAQIVELPQQDEESSQKL
jgi:hypothetical protein